MPVVPRASDAGNGTVITSPNVAAKTVVGMVLGILCLFTMVLTYQFIACPHRKRAAAARRVPRNASQAAKTAHTPSKTTSRSFRTCSNLFGRSSSKPAPTNRAPGTSEKRARPEGPKDGRRSLRALLLPFASHGTSTAPESPPSLSQPKPTLLERKGLRALRLNTELLKSDGKQRYPATPSPTTTPARKRMGRVFEFASSPLSTPSSSSTLFSAGTPTPTSTGRRHRYKKLADDKLYSYSDWSNEAAYPTGTSRPPEALVSPWSPNERQYPYAPYSPLSVRWLSDSHSPRTPPPLYPPPPAYLPEVPVRSDGLGSAPATPTRPSGGGPGGGGGRMTSPSPLVPPVSPIIRRLSEEVDGEIGSWEPDMPDIRAALASVVTLRVDRRPDGEAGRDEDDVFVIADGSDSGDEEGLESVSLHTATDEYESMEPLSL